MCSQEPATGLYCETGASNTHPQTLFFFKFILMSLNELHIA